MLERNVRWYQALPVILAVPAIYFGLFVWSWKTAEYDYQRVERQEKPIFAFKTSEDTGSGSTADEGAPPGNSPVADDVTQTCYTGVGYRIVVNSRDARNLRWQCLRLEYTWRWLWPGLGLRMHGLHTHQTTPIDGK